MDLVADGNRVVGIELGCALTGEGTGKKIRAEYVAFQVGRVIE